MNISSFKRKLLKIFNDTYLVVFGFGVKRLTIDIAGNRITIVGEHSRLPGLIALDETNRFVTRMTDVALLDECKKRIRMALEESIPEVKVRTILKDYDPATEITATVIVTDQAIDTLYQN